MTDNKGPATGCSGNLVWIFDQDNPPWLFREGLGKMKDFLQQYKFRGMLDLNTIVSDTKLYGLEWTPRFGYDATATQSCLITSNLGDFWGCIASGVRPEINCKSGFAASVRLSIPPYPSEIKGKHGKDIPIQGIKPEDIESCYLFDACLDDEGDLVTAGVNGLIAVPIACGDSIDEAFGRCYHKIDNITIPDCQYRTDIRRLTKERYRVLESQGWLR